MKVGIIGSGKVAFHLAKKLQEFPEISLEMRIRNKERAAFFQSMFAFDLKENISEDAALIFICVKDDAISQVAKTLEHHKAVIVHTAGSVGIEQLSPLTRTGVWYPLQTFSESRGLDWKEIPVFLETQNKNDIIFLRDFTEKLTPKVRTANSEQRKYIHLTAVFSCNFVNHLWSISEQICQEHDLLMLDFYPLIEETFNKMKTHGAQNSQTGPALRNDTEVMSNQIQLLENPDEKKIYEDISRSIINYHQKKT